MQTSGYRGCNSISYPYENMLMVALSLHHHESREIRNPMDPMRMPQEGYNTFHLEVYNAKKPLVHWLTPKFIADIREVDSWDQHWRMCIKNFPLLEDTGTWIHTPSRFAHKLTVQGLHHLIDMDYIVTNSPLDARQWVWMYHTLQVIMRHPMCESIVEKHALSKDTQKICQEICSSMGEKLVTPSEIDKGATFPNLGDPSHVTKHKDNDVSPTPDTTLNPRKKTCGNLNRFPPDQKSSKTFLVPPDECDIQKQRNRIVVFIQLTYLDYGQAALGWLCVPHSVGYLVD